MSDAAPHTIRLRGPWEGERLERFLPDGSTAVDACRLGRVTMPCDWNATLGIEFHGRVRFTRNFNRPTNLVSQRVWLVIERLVGSATVEFNGEPLTLESGRAEITARLRPFNTIVAEFHLPVEQTAPPGPICDARLEIVA